MTFLSRDHAPPKKWETSIEITACLVAEESELAYLDEWSARWNGPISLLVTTTHPVNSHHYNLLARRLSMLGSSNSRLDLSNILPSTNSARGKSRGNRIAAHLLSIPFSRRIVPNTNNLLNIARIHSRSDAVMLFPLGLTNPPILNLHNKLLESKLGPGPVIIPRNRSPLPSLNSTRIPNSSFLTSYHLDPTDPDASLFIMRNDRLWCPERFFTTSPDKIHAASNHAFHVLMLREWSECLWRVLLEHPRSFPFRSGPGVGDTLWRSPPIAWSDGSVDVDLGGKSRGSDVHVRIVCNALFLPSLSLLRTFTTLDTGPRKYISSIPF